MSTESEGSRVPILVAICAPVWGAVGDEPPSHPPIDGPREWRRVCEAATSAKDPNTGQGAPLQIVRLHPPTLAKLREILNAGPTRRAYPMVHIIGYVPEDGSLRMEQENGREGVVSPIQLARACEGTGVQIALLNICSGFTYAKALLDVGVLAVVTTLQEIFDPEATLLARELYLRLAFGDCIQDAHAYAQRSIEDAYCRGDLTLPPACHRITPDDYGRQRAKNIVLLGEGKVCLPLPSPGEAANEPDFTLSEPPKALPLPDVFIGREAELVRISNWMDDHRFRIIALTGVAGIGKSSLALMAAQRNSWHFQGVIYLTAKGAVGSRTLTLDDLCREIDAVLKLDNRLINLSTPEARRQRVVEVLNAGPYLLVLDNIEVLSAEQAAEWERFLKQLEPLSGTMALLTLRPEHFPPLVDQTGDLYHLSVGPLDRPAAVTLLYELLKPPVAREPTEEERLVWRKVPPRQATSDDQEWLETLLNRADTSLTDIPLTKVTALAELAEAANYHPWLLRSAAANLRESGDEWHAVLYRLQALWDEDWQAEVADMIDGTRDGLVPGNLEWMHRLHLPAPPSFFAGRREEMAQLRKAVRTNTPSVIVVVGMGGQGKTTLVYQWLREHERPRFAAGLWCTAYRGGFSFDMFLDEALDYLLQGKFDKRELPNVAARVTKLLGLLQQRPTLIVIDGIERWLVGWHRGTQDRQTVETVEERAGYFEGLDDFLRSASGICNGTHFIFTTRAVPAALDNTEITVIPVEDKREGDRALKGLDPEASVTLLRRLGVQGEDDQIKDVAASYAYHPLALTVLGSLLHNKYGGRLERLPNVTALDPKDALFKLFDETRKNLPGRTAAEQLLHVASHAIENPPLAAIAAAMPTSVVAPDELLEHVVTLARWHLIGWDGKSEIVHLHPLVKQYFSGLVDVSESVTIHEWFSTWYAQQPIPDDASSQEHVHPRILAIEHALLASNMERCRDLCCLPINKTYPFVEWLVAWGHLTVGIALLAKLAKAAPSLMRAEFLITRAALQRQLGALDDAHSDLDEAIALFDSSGPRLPSDQLANLVGALMNRGNVLWQASRLAEAIKDYDRALTILDRMPRRDHTRRVLTTRVLMNRAIALHEMGRFSEAVGYCNQALQMCRDLVASGGSDLELVLPSVLINRGNVLADQQNYEDALQDFTEAIAVCERLIQSGRQEMVSLLAHARIMKATTLNDAGDSEKAIHEVDEAIGALQHLIDDGWRHLESLLALSWTSRSLACIRLQRWREVLDDCKRAIDLYNPLIYGGRGDLTGRLAYVLMNRSQALYAIGDTKAAAADRIHGLDLMQRLIAKGEPETRVGYLRKSISAAKYLIAAHPIEAMELLKRAVSETERGLAEGHAVEALQIESQRALSELSSVELVLRQVDPYNAIIRRLQACVCWHQVEAGRMGGMRRGLSKVLCAFPWFRDSLWFLNAKGDNDGRR